MLEQYNRESNAYTAVFSYNFIMFVTRKHLETKNCLATIGMYVRGIGGPQTDRLSMDKR